MQSNLPTNIFNFTIKYLNKSLPMRKNLSLWNLSQLSDCEFCLLPETLLHVVAGCKVYLEQGRYTWRHNSALNFLATSLKAIEGPPLFADIPGFSSPSIITGDNLRPDLLLRTKENILYVLELTIGFKTNLNCNAERKNARLVSDLRPRFKSVIFVNLSISSLGFSATHAAHSLKCVTLFPSMINTNDISFLSFLRYPFVPPITFFAVGIKKWINPELLPF